MDIKDVELFDCDDIHEEFGICDVPFAVCSEDLENGVHVVTYTFSRDTIQDVHLEEYATYESFDDKLFEALSSNEQMNIVKVVREYCEKQHIPIRGVCFSEQVYDDEIVYLKPLDCHLSNVEYINEIKHQLELISK